MLAPILIELLIGCSLMLLAGWAGEAFRAGARSRPTQPPLQKASRSDRNESSVEPVVMRRLGHDVDGSTVAEPAP